MIEDEYHKLYIETIREKYNFFKHADRDIDATLEVNADEMHDLNEMMLAMNISGYQHIFRDVSKAASAYAKWFTVCHPDSIKWENIPGSAATQAQISNLKMHDPVSNRQMLRGWLYSE